ncbi:MAG: FAD:protein FMN transferase [Chitinophagales bacterium]
MKRLLILSSILLFCQYSFSQFSYSKDTILMGSAFNFTAIHAEKEGAQQAVFAGIQEVYRIECFLSSWKDSSETSAINRNAGKQAVKVSLELYDLLLRSKKISALSNGYFDVSFASINKLWQFNQQEQLAPDSALVKQSIQKINYKNIVLDSVSSSVFLLEEGMKIGFGAIGKGYAADRAKELMKNLGAESGVVNAGGDVLAWGTKLDGSLWTIGIADPAHKNEILSTIEIDNFAIVTSGDYERYLTIKEERYGHIINPKTGYPVKGVLSVTVLAPTAELADALATTIFILGEEEGIALANHLKGVECILINAENKFFFSEGIQLNLFEDE